MTDDELIAALRAALRDLLPDAEANILRQVNVYPAAIERLVAAKRLLDVQPTSPSGN